MRAKLVWVIILMIIFLLVPEEQKKLKTGERDVFTLLNRPEHKFQKSVIIAGGVSFFGTTNLIILEGTMNHLAYV